MSLGVDYRAVMRWTAAFRTWFIALHPSGAYEARVRLGMAPSLSGLVCPACGATGTLAYYGFAVVPEGGTGARRQLRCSACGAFTLLDESAVLTSAEDRAGSRTALHAGKPQARPRQRRVAPIESEMPDGVWVRGRQKERGRLEERPRRGCCYA
ncbi:DUF746 domain-containing protein [Sphingomonas cavernae]|nr:DUF746 domain-containing protein [Sphingomonas cavernae]